MKEHDACHESDAPQNLTNVRRHLSGRVVDFRGRAPSATHWVLLPDSSWYSSYNFGEVWPFSERNRQG